MSAQTEVSDAAPPELLAALLLHSHEAAHEYVARAGADVADLARRATNLARSCQRVLMRDPAAYLSMKVPDPYPPVGASLFDAAMNASSGEPDSAGGAAEEILLALDPSLQQVQLLSLMAVANRIAFSAAMPRSQGVLSARPSPQPA